MAGADTVSPFRQGSPDRFDSEEVDGAGVDGAGVDGAGVDESDFVENVLDVVERIPPGRVMTYGDIAEFLGRGGPRQVGSVMSREGAGVPWWRVIRADGRTARGLEESALRRLRDEGCALRGERVDLARARWIPDAPDGSHAGDD